jgi:hypothetical protein
MFVCRHQKSGSAWRHFGDGFQLSERQLRSDNEITEVRGRDSSRRTDRL